MTPQSPEPVSYTHLDVYKRQDLERALSAVDEVRQMLSLRGEAFSKDVEFGIMIETPAAALMADELAVRAAFFSVGTNDLTQYTHAADRVNPAVEQYYTPASPAVLRLLRFVARSAADADIGVSVDVYKRQVYLSYFISDNIYCFWGDTDSCTYANNNSTTDFNQSNILFVLRCNKINKT